MGGAPAREWVAPAREEGAPPPFRPTTRASPRLRAAASCGLPLLPCRAGRRSLALTRAASPTARLRICVGGERGNPFLAHLSPHDANCMLRCLICWRWISCGTVSAEMQKWLCIPLLESV